jgi:hypothetical protein
VRKNTKKVLLGFQTAANHFEGSVLVLGKSTLVGNRNHLPDQVLARDPDPEEFV